MSTKFLQDLHTGHDAEDFVVHIFEKHGYEIVKQATGYFPPYDFACLDRAGNIRKVEVKYDRKAHQTGNFFFEIEALGHSEADILVYCYGQPISKLYFYDLPTLYTQLRAKEPTARGGDKMELGWLFPKESFNPKIVQI